MRARALLTFVILTPLLLASCSGADQRGSSSARMGAWVRTTTFGERVGELRANVMAVGELAAKPLTSEVLSTRCAVILVDVQADNGDLPSPDRRVTEQLAKAYTAFSRAGLRCAQEAKGGAVAPSAAVVSGLSGATAQLLEAMNRIELVSGRAIATTTTVPPAA